MKIQHSIIFRVPQALCTSAVDLQVSVKERKNVTQETNLF